MQRVAHDKVIAGKPLPDPVYALPEEGHNTGSDKALQIACSVHAFHGDEGQDIGLVQPDAGVHQGIHGIGGKNHSEHNHQEKAPEKGQHRQMTQHAFVPPVPVIQQKKNEIDAGHDFPEAVPQGEKGNVQPEAHKEQAVPEFTGVGPVEFAPGGPSGLQRHGSTLVFCHIFFPAQPRVRKFWIAYFNRTPMSIQYAGDAFRRQNPFPALTQRLQKE